MPRGARLDSPGTLHHVIVRGIERKEIVNDHEDRKNFLTRMGDIALETGTAIYAWVLMKKCAEKIRQVLKRSVQGVGYLVYPG